MVTRAQGESGQSILEAMVAYIEKFVCFPASIAGGHQSMVLALWAMHTWFYDRFPMTPKVTITASTKQAGKTLCMEVLGPLCQGPEQLATLRPLALLRVIKMSGGRSTLFVDEAEKLSSAAIGDLRSIFTTGSYPGGFHIITKGEEVSRFSTHAPACFALIGDVMDVVRDRSIVIHLERDARGPAGDFRGNRLQAQSEAALLVRRVKAYFDAMETDIEVVQPAFLSGRDREVWTAIFSMASALGLNVATMRSLTAAATDLVGLKSADRREFSSVVDEAKASLAAAAERAIRDLASVLPEPIGEATGHIFSAVAVERMKGIPEGPWRTYKGVGLTAEALAAMVGLFGVGTHPVRMGKGRTSPTNKQLNGYRRSEVLAKVPAQRGDQ